MNTVLDEKQSVSSKNVCLYVYMLNRRQNSNSKCFHWLKKAVFKVSNDAIFIENVTYIPKQICKQKHKEVNGCKAVSIVERRATDYIYMKGLIIYFLKAEFRRSPVHEKQNLL